MTKHFLREIDKLKSLLLSVGSLVEQSLSQAIKAIIKSDNELAQGVLDNDEKIDALEVEVEEECLKILALHQPVAKDLRFVIAVLKINNDLERIGDLACNIAWRAKALASNPNKPDMFMIGEMVKRVQSMVTRALDALISSDSQIARQICSEDDQIDMLNHENYEHFQNLIKTSPQNIDSLLMMIYVSRNLERIADHATNIAEDIIYLVDGEITRHKRFI